jgi:hypothetical protein
MEKAIEVKQLEMGKMKSEEGEHFMRNDKISIKLSRLILWALSFPSTLVQPLKKKFYG